MLRLSVSFPSRLALAAAAGLLLVALPPAATLAAGAAHRTYPLSAHAVTQPNAQAQFPSNNIYPFSSDDPTACIGGYRWTQRFDDANQTPAESEVPLPCR